MGIFKWLYSLVTGHILLEARLKSIDEHIIIINGEVGRIDSRQEAQDMRLDRIGEDVAYIKGRLDKPGNGGR